MKQRPQRRSIRLPGWDYRFPGFYFVTICTDSRRNLFTDERLYEVAANAWTFIPNHPHAKYVVIDEWILMPNHHHGILNFTSDTGSIETAGSLRAGPLPGSLGAVIGNYKMLVTRRVKALLRATGSDLQVWQRG